MGIVMQAAVEHEFYLARETPAGYELFDRSLCYSSIGFDTSARIIDDIITALEQQDMQVEQFMPELGLGQQESRSITPRRCVPPITRYACVKPSAVWPSNMASLPHLPPSRSSTRLAMARISIVVFGEHLAQSMPEITYCMTPRDAVA